MADKKTAQDGGKSNGKGSSNNSSEKNSKNNSKANPDYATMGFKCGLEIHQQLDTKKLFCACQSMLSEGKPDRTVMRRLRASAGETGAVDAAAMHEQKKGKYFTYNFYSESCCLVELDEEPPMPMNMDALRIAMQAALLLNMRLVDEIQVMRKTVVDGSNTSGFQRTCLVAMNGWMETSKGRVSIPTLCLEEDAAQVVERKENSDVYNLSRLGIPLVEIATGTEIRDPEHAMECAEKIGMVLRSIPGIKRGIGTIRQDVNLSIRGAARVEIKGFQELKSIPKIVSYEVERQLAAVSKGEKLSGEVRKAEPDMTTSFLRPMPGADRMYPETDIFPIVPDAKSVELPELMDEKIKRYASDYGMSSELAGLAARKGVDIDRLAKKYRSIKPLFFAEYFITMPKEIRKRHGIDADPTAHEKELLGRLDSGRIGKEAVMEILVELSRGNSVDYEKYASVPDSEIEDEIRKIVDSNPGKTQGALMGMAMAKLRGKADGKKVAGIISNLLRNSSQ